MKEYTCVQVYHHNKIAEKTDEMQTQGWLLNAYQAAGDAVTVMHYLLFERGK